MRRILTLAFLWLAAFPALAQRAHFAGKTMLVLPFDNRSQVPGIEWIGEAFPEVLSERVTGVFVVPRENRLYALDRMGIPATLHPSRATLYRIAEEMDVDYVVVGSYTFDGRTFNAEAQVLDMSRLRLLPPKFEGGSLTNLLDIANAMAWDILHDVPPGPRLSRQEFLATSSPVRLDAFENYVRGITDAARSDKIKHLREAVRLNPTYTLAVLQLGRAYFDARDYASAAMWLERVPQAEPQGQEASFFLGLARYYLGDYKRSDEAFRIVAARMPLTEVYNNLGVVAGRRGIRNELEFFQKAVTADPHDADYHFNYGIALLRFGDAAAGVRQLKEAFALKPGDSEAKALIDSLGSAKPADAAVRTLASTQRLPLERIKRNYDESHFREVALEIENMNELKMASQSPQVHAGFHVERGREMLRQGFMGEAEKNFREAISLDPTRAAAHAGLAIALESRNPAAARAEARSAIQLGPSAEPYLVLARLDLSENNLAGAADDLDHALAIEPGNSAALALQRVVTARLPNGIGQVQQ
ncbi:MAG: tetratricopeptide repeat protein [Acidobacteria bacterium]|nr:tetratricopeptide repeat protein [Acidobacteriota bacterium]